MAFPQGTDYNVAVQTPRTSFSDPHLQACLPETTPLGLPKPYSGGFTTTYHLSNKQLGYDWAVRCFTRHVPDLAMRYQALERFFNQHHREPFFVKTWHLNHGVRAAGGWHPTIKMQWVEGASLDSYVRSTLRAPRAIAQLAAGFAALTQRLEQIGFAHGDLQHGNILVKGGQPHLIDYDGSYVPEIAGLGTNNLGHVNYQHPGRNETLFDARMDRFSAIVIYLGLVAVAAQPRLWIEFDNGENILFRRADFADPKQSQLLDRLCALDQITLLANRFKQICGYDPQDAPSLDAFIRGDYATPGPSPRVARAPAPWYGQRSQYPVIDCDERKLLLQHVGERVEVIGCISSIYENVMHRSPSQCLTLGKHPYPNHGMELVLWADGLNSFHSVKRDMRKLVHRWISVTGVISVSKTNGRLMPQIIIDNQAQIQELADGANAARARLAAYALHSGAPATTRPSRTIIHWQQKVDQQHATEAATVFNRLYGEQDRAPVQLQPQTTPSTPWYRHTTHILGYAAPPPRVIGSSPALAISPAHTTNVANASAPPTTASRLAAPPPLPSPPSLRARITHEWRKLWLKVSRWLNLSS